MSLTFTPVVDLNQKLPDFKIQSLHGDWQKSLDIQNNKSLLIVFMCNHCPYIKAIEDRLIELGKDLKKLGVTMIGICSNDSTEHPEDSFSELKKRADEKNYSFEYFHDEDQSAARALGAVCTPDFFLFNSDGFLKYRGRLDDSWKDPALVTRRELFEAAQMVVSEKDITFRQTPSMGCNIKWKMN